MQEKFTFYHFQERFLAIFLFKLYIPINFVAERVSNDGRNEYRRPTICKMARIEKSACAHTDASPSRRLCRDTQRHLHRTVRRWWCHALPHATDIPEHQTSIINDNNLDLIRAYNTVRDRAKELIGELKKIQKEFLPSTKRNDKSTSLNDATSLTHASPEDCATRHSSSS